MNKSVSEIMLGGIKSLVAVLFVSLTFSISAARIRREQQKTISKVEKILKNIILI